MEVSYLERLRSRFGSGPVPLAYATALIRDGDGRVLFQRRGDFPIWGLPGGLLEPGETIREALVREAREETGYEVRPVRFVGLYSSPEFTVRYPNGDRVQQVTACFDCEIAGGSGRPDGREALAQEFLDPRDPPEIFPWYRRMLLDRDKAGPTPFDRGAAETENPYPEGIVRRLRSAVGTEPILLPCAAAVVLDPEGRILLQRRADSGLWGLPSGAMEIGERIDRTAVREAREETGLAVRVERLTGFYTGPEQFTVYPNGDRAWLAVAVFLCSVESGELRPDRVESLDARFFSRESLPLDHEPWGSRTRTRIRDALEAGPEAIAGS